MLQSVKNKTSTLSNFVPCQKALIFLTQLYMDC